MVKQLRRKLVGAYVLATGLLLSLIVTGLLLLSLNQYETNNISRYQTVFGNVWIRSGTVIKSPICGWLKVKSARI